MKRRQPTPANDPNSAQAAYVLALRWITGRELSAARVREKLTARGFADPAVSDALTRLVSNRVIDDRRAANVIARGAARVRRHGPRRIHAKLVSLGFERDLADETIRDLFQDLDEDALLEAALEKRLRGSRDRLSSPQERRKIVAYLARLGFSTSAAFRLVRQKSK